MQGLRGKTAVVFGAGGGIGTATCLMLAAEGVNVVVTSRREATVQGIAEQIREAGADCLALAVDIGDEAAVEAAVAVAVDAYGGVDFAHVNAADTSPDTIGRDSDVATIELDVFDRTIRTNLRGMRHVASRWGKEGIRANVIAIGLTLTETIEKALEPAYLDQILATMRSPRLGRPDDIAGMVTYLMSSSGEWINGQVISVDGGSTIR